MERRQSARVATSGGVSFVGEHLAGAGQLYNLSPHGCAIGGYIPMPAGAHLRLNLHLTDQDDPVTIELGTVRWTRDYRFGVEFLVASRKEQTRLHAHLSRLSRPPSPDS